MQRFGGRSSSIVLLMKLCSESEAFSTPESALSLRWYLVEEGYTTFLSLLLPCCMHAEVAARITVSLKKYLGRGVQKVLLEFWQLSLIPRRISTSMLSRKRLYQSGSLKESSK